MGEEGSTSSAVSAEIIKNVARDIVSLMIKKTVGHHKFRPTKRKKVLKVLVDYGGRKLKQK